MTAASRSFKDDYSSALRSYLATGGETGLESAYELGRQAVSSRLGLLDLAGIHNAALTERLADFPARADVDRVLSAGSEFFMESLSIFEMTQRGFREAQETAALQRDLALTLQRNLLPDGLPSLPGFDCAVRYLAGGQGVEVGGDWYEVLELPGERVGFAVGDVVGRGVAAACVMGQLRIAFRAYALEFESPAVVADHLGAFLTSLDSAKISTCLYAVFDASAGTMELVNAGHPPPLLLGPGHDARFVEETRGMPLGVVDDPHYKAALVDLEPGSTLVIYTDGLVEKRSESIDVGLGRLKAAAEAAPSEAAPLVDRIVGSLVSGEPDDDVAVLAVRLAGSDSSPLDLTIPANPVELGRLRRAMKQWLRNVGAGEDEAGEILLATTEAVANAVEHAYGPGPSSVDIRVELSGGEVRVDVRDHGRWRGQRNPRRGRGLGIMRALMDEVEIEDTDEGTSARLRRRLKGARRDE